MGRSFKPRKPAQLSGTATELLRAIAKYGTIRNADDPNLVEHSSPGLRAIYNALATLQGRGLIVWEPGGTRIRPTPAGWQLARRIGFTSAPRTELPTDEASAS